MNNEQFFKAIDGVDDELLKDALDPEFDYVQYPKVYRLEKRRFNWKAAAACAACLAAVVGAGFALKSGLSALPVQSEPSDMSGAADSSVLDGENSANVNLAIHENLPFGYHYNLKATFPDFGNGDSLSVTQAQTVTANLHVDFDPDPCMPLEDIPYRIFVFADGKPIEFATAGSDDYALCHDYVMDNVISAGSHEDGVVTLGEVTADKTIHFKADEKTKNLIFVASFYPKYVQPLDWGGFTGVISTFAVNTSCTVEGIPEEKETARYIEPYGRMKGFGGIEVFLEGDDPTNYTRWNLEYSDNKNTVYMEFKRKDSPYYLFLLIDGELVPVFDGDYTCFVDNQDGTRLFQYQILPEYLPDEGLHTIQGMAIPANPNTYSGTSLVSTQRIRTVAVEVNGNNSVAIGLLHGFEIDHFQRSFSDRESEFFTRVPDGMLPEYDFTKVGEMVGNGWRDSCDGIEFYSFPDNKDFILALIDGEYVPFVDAKVCGKYGITSAAELSYITYPGSSSGFVHFTDLVKFGDRAELELSSDIYSALMYANTVEELKQGLSECMHSERISEVVFYKNKEDYANGIKIENPSGVFRVGMCIRVYYDGHNSYLDRIVRNNRIDGRFYPEANEPVRDNCYPEDGRLD